MATLTRYRPFQPLRSLQREIDRVFGEYGPIFGDEEGEAGIWSPAMDLTEMDREYVVKMELPGIPKDKVTVKLEDHRLIVQGERKVEKKEKTASRLMIERRHGSFYRSIALPKAASEEEVEASMHDGILSIRIKKTEDARSRRIEVK